ncbi:hypothetical protein RWH45_06585 [Microbacterium sp. KSW4-17]|uniref:Uncharacterized protein n=1 Tax=Microbacterium galbum TaxID=3075994 RepID=A0ABU3T682_9MICO|nr:hypothetical protein [Microbacterium sp. KSW4-17]MDU0366876.1 hypothetical protein [Microbacterium sp. KSW4-17]
MIPRFDIDVKSTIPSDATFWVPSDEDLADGEGIGFFHDTHLIVADLDEARRVMEAERIAAGFADEQSTTIAGFEVIADQAEFEFPDLPSEEAPAFMTTGDAWYGVNELEIGVAGLVHALNAVGVVTAASCRGHHGVHRRWAAGPVVVFAADRTRTELLQGMVEASGCGFDRNGVDHPKLLAVVAPSILEMMDLADRVVADADAFA